MTRIEFDEIREKEYNENLMRMRTGELKRQEVSWPHRPWQGKATGAVRLLEQSRVTALSGWLAVGPLRIGPAFF